MDAVKLALVLLVLILGSITAYLSLHAVTQSAQLDQAVEANRAVRDLLRLQGVSCSGSVLDFTKTSSCIAPLLLAKDFKEGGFAQPDDRKGTSGYVVILNTNRRLYNSQGFTFLFNRQVLQEGCTIPGEIGLNVACRFNFYQYCEKGSVLEVNYTDGNTTSKVFTKVC